MELDGEGKRRRDGWRFDRFEVSGEDGGREAGVCVCAWRGLDCESDAWITWSERVRDGTRRLVEFYGPTAADSR